MPINLIYNLSALQNALKGMKLNCLLNRKISTLFLLLSTKFSSLTSFLPSRHHTPLIPTAQCKKSATDIYLISKSGLLIKTGNKTLSFFLQVSLPQKQVHCQDSTTKILEFLPSILQLIYLKIPNNISSPMLIMTHSMIFFPLCPTETLQYTLSL